MATPLTPTDIGGVLQKAYAADPEVEALFSKFPAWNLISKVGNTGGESFTMACIYQASTRVGSSPSAIYNQTQLAPAAQFLLKPQRQYGYSSIDGLAIAQAGIGMEKKQLASFINIVHSENVALAKTMAKLHALYMARAGTGTLGTIDSSTILASNILTLAKRSDQYNFEEGQVLQLAPTDGGVPRSGTITVMTVPGDGTLRIGINQVANNITDATNGVPLAQLGDFIVMNGDGQAAAFPGFKSWCPFAVTKGTFATVNRDLAPRKLAGLFVDASAEGLTIDAAVSAGLNRFKANEGEATHCFLNPFDYESLAQTGSTQVVLDQGGAREFGFDSLSFKSDGTHIRVFEDPTFPMGEAWICNLPKLEMRFVWKPMPAIDDRDGLTIRKSGTNGADNWEMTFVSYPYGVCMKNGAIPGRTLCGVKLY